jgi:hypothetical protein
MSAKLKSKTHLQKTFLDFFSRVNFLAVAVCDIRMFHFEMYCGKLAKL